MASDAPGLGGRVVRAILVGLLGSVLGTIAGAVAGGVFGLEYRPHYGGQVGDVTSVYVLFGTVILGCAIGLIAGLVWGALRRPIWQLVAGLSAIGFVGTVLLVSLVK
jgi:hypothetical protein